MSKPKSLRVSLRQFMELRYPGKCRGKNVYGIELILLDAEIYHAVRRIAYGSRKPEALEYVGRLELEARMVLYALEHDAYDYLDQARKLAQMALDAVSVERRPAVHLVEAVIADDSPPPDWVAAYASVIDERAFGVHTALTTAARLGRVNWCTALLNTGADPLLANGISWTPLALAAVSGQAATLRILLEAGVDPNREHYHGDPPTWIPPLWWAVYYEHDC